MWLEDLRKFNRLRNELYPGSEHIDTSFRAIELAGEVGELMNAVKKLKRASRGIAGNAVDTKVLRANLQEEFGDVLICLDLLAMELGIDLSVATKRKFNKTSDKLGLPVKFDLFEAQENAND